jgi:hypothetical protein
MVYSLSFLPPFIVHFLIVYVFRQNRRPRCFRLGVHDVVIFKIDQ